MQFNLDERTENFPCAARHSTEPKNYLSLFGVFPWMVFSHCVYLMWLDSNWRIHRYVFYWSVRSVNLYLTLPDRKKETLSVLVSIKKVTYEQSIFLGSVCVSRLSLENKENFKKQISNFKLLVRFLNSLLGQFVRVCIRSSYTETYVRSYLRSFVYIHNRSFIL